jgi:PAS domain S-box-containing protein
MISFKNVSIKNKLILIQIATGVIAVLICCVIFIYNDINAFKESSRKNKYSIAEIVGENAIAPLTFNDKKAAEEILFHFKSNASILNAAIFDKKGVEFATYNKNGEEAFSFEMPDESPALMHRLFEPKFIVSYKIFQDKEFIGTVKLKTEINDFNVIIYNYIKIAIIVLIIGAFSAFIIAVFFQRIISKRLLSLVDKTREVTETANYSIRSTLNGTDEIEVLSDGFNNMLEQIEQREKTLKEINTNLEEKVKERTADLTKIQAILKINEEKYRKIVEETGDAVYSSDYKGYFTYVNPVCKKLTGYMENELLGKHFLEIIAPDWKEKVENFYKEQFENKVKETLFSFPIITKSGERRWVEQNVTQIKEGDFITGQNSIVRDITERKLAEEKAKEYQYFFNNSHDLITITNDSYFEIINPNFQKVLGYTEKELLEHRFLDFIHPDDLSATLQELEKNKNGIETTNFTNRYRKKDGSYLLFEWNITPDILSGKFYASARDITDRKKSEVELIKSNDRFMKIFESSSFGMVLVNLKTNNFQYVNKFFLTKFGYKSEEVIGKTATDIKIIEPESYEKVMSLFKQQGYVYDFEALVRKKNGETFWSNSSLQIIKINDEDFFLSSFFDISERKKAEEELRKANKLTESILENIPNMIFLKDVTDLRFVLFNKAGENLLGAKRDELIGKTNYDLFTKEQADLSTLKDKESLQKGTLIDIPEESISVKNGQYWLHTKKLPIMDEEGKPTYLLGISEDITEQRKIQEEKKILEKKLNQNIQEIKLILENIGEGVIVIDKNSNIILSNHTAEEIIGVNIPVDWSVKFNLFYPDGEITFPAQSLPLLKALKGEQTDELEIIIQDQLSMVRKRVKLNGRPIIDENNYIIAAVATIKDITALADLTEQLHRSEMKYRNQIGFHNDSKKE